MNLKPLLEDVPGLFLLIALVAVIGVSLAFAFSWVEMKEYVTLNHYVEVPGSAYAHLLWAPQYSGRKNDVLHPFINRLCGKWFEFLDREIGPFDVSLRTDAGSVLKGTRAIPPPVKKGYPPQLETGV